MIRAKVENQEHYMLEVPQEDEAASPASDGNKLGWSRFDFGWRLDLTLAISVPL